MKITHATLSLLLATACAAEPDDSLTVPFRNLSADEGVVVDGATGTVYAAGTVCILYVYTATGPVGLTLPFDDEPPGPGCGVLTPYLDRLDVFVQWDPADVTPMGSNAAQNLAEAFDRPIGRDDVAYGWLGGSIQASLWGTAYGDLEEVTAPGLGDACALYLETDEGTPYYLLDVQQPDGSCPNLDAVAPFAPIAVPLDELDEVTDPADASALESALSPVDGFLVVGVEPFEI